MCGFIPPGVIYSKFHGNPFRGFWVPGVDVCPFQLLWLLAFTTACTQCKPWLLIGRDYYGLSNCAISDDLEQRFCHSSVASVSKCDFSHNFAALEHCLWCTICLRLLTCYNISRNNIHKILCIQSKYYVYKASNALVFALYVAVKYFMFLICICVLAVLVTVVVQYLYLRSESKPLAVMSIWVSRVLITFIYTVVHPPILTAS